MFKKIIRKFDIVSRILLKNNIKFDYGKWSERIWDKSYVVHEFDVSKWDMIIYEREFIEWKNPTKEERVIICNDIVKAIRKHIYPFK